MRAIADLVLCWWLLEVREVLSVYVLSGYQARFFVCWGKGALCVSSLLMEGWGDGHIGSLLTCTCGQSDVQLWPLL